MSAEEESMPLRAEPAQDEHHVVLVHGTWGHGMWRSWFWNFLAKEKREREISWPLRAALEQGRTRVHSFNWSGRNTHAARENAGELLAAFIDERIPSGHSLSMVAHSHGGAVACYALRRLAHERICALAFLATPFLHFRPQTLGIESFRLLPGALGYAGAVVFDTVILLAYALTLSTDWILVPTWVVLSAGVLAMIPGAYLGYRLGMRIVAALGRMPVRLAEICKAHEPATPPAQGTLILLNVADEARGALAAGGIVEWLLAKAWNLLGALVRLPPRVSQFLSQKLNAHPIAVGAVVLGAIVLPPLLLRFLGDPITKGFVYSLAGLAAAILAICLIQVVLFLLILLLNVVRFGFVEDFFASALLQVVAEPAPLGKWSIEIFPGAGFAHSEIHENPDVATRIASWIKGAVQDRTNSSGVRTP